MKKLFFILVLQWMMTSFVFSQVMTQHFTKAEAINKGITLKNKRIYATGQVPDI